MFTGIIQGTFPVVDIFHEPGLNTLTIRLDETLVRGLETGASVSVSGVCLTVVAIDGSFVVFEAMQETLDCTTLGSVHVGDEVNIERSARLGDEIGWHLVSGHVTGMAEICEITKSENNFVVRLKVDPVWIEAILPKGFIALDGASLTVHLIPETLARTTFVHKKIGDRVNLELDSYTVALVSTMKRMLGM